VQEYEVRRGHQENIETAKLKAHMQEIFGKVEEKDGKLVSSFGALKEISAWSGKKNTLMVDTKMDPAVADDVAQQTIKAYNTFLERATGLTAKERGKRAQKKVKAGKL
jgi:hypothetical protein